MKVNQDQFREAMSRFATGVTVISVDDHGKVHGMTANAFASVSLDPLLVLVCVDHSAQTHAHLETRKRFGVNVLAEEQSNLSEYFANPERFNSDPEIDSKARFDRTIHGTPVLQGALVYLECRLQDAHEAGDHTVFIAEVEEIVIRPGAPLLYYGSRYRKLGPTVP
jgi:flavin reductase (DIM6/NTAB) family NADH-FMN oxidoreductase RutF